MKPEMHDGWGIHDPRQGGTGDREAYLQAFPSQTRIRRSTQCAPCVPTAFCSSPASWPSWSLPMQRFAAPRAPKPSGSRKTSKSQCGRGLQPTWCW